jgi:hypothetical protein
VDIGDIVAELNSKKPAHLRLLVFTSTIALVSILAYGAWRLSKRAKY